QELRKAVERAVKGWETLENVLGGAGRSAELENWRELHRRSRRTLSAVLTLLGLPLQLSEEAVGQLYGACSTMWPMTGTASRETVARAIREADSILSSEITEHLDACESDEGVEERPGGAGTGVRDELRTLQDSVSALLMMDRAEEAA